MHDTRSFLRACGITSVEPLLAEIDAGPTGIFKTSSRFPSKLPVSTRWQGTLATHLH